MRPLALSQLLRAQLIALCALLALMTAPLPALAVDPSTTLEGTLALNVVEPLPSSGAVVEYNWVLNSDDGQSVALNVDGQALGLTPGQHVEVRGTQIGEQGGIPLIAPQTKGIAASGRVQALSAPTSGDKRVAVVLFNFVDDMRQPWTPGEVNDNYFSAGATVRQFFSELSNGAWDLTGDVLGYYTIAADRSSCNLPDWTARVAEELAIDDVSLASYSNVQYIYPGQSSCNFAGVGELGGRVSWLNGTIWSGFATHELGHNFGAHHANTLSCSADGHRVAFSSDCVSSEYGDPFDNMGNGDMLWHAWHRIDVGALPIEAEQTISASGIYTVAPATSGSGVRLLRIARPDPSLDSLYIDFRQSGGVFERSWQSSDPILHGVAIRLAPRSGVVQSQLIDTTPSTSTFADAPLIAGRSFTDPVAGVTITTQSVSSAGATVAVSFASAPLNLPTTVVRSAGADRYETAATFARDWVGSSDVLLLASGTNFPDALSGVPAAAAFDAPMLLVRGGRMPAATQAELTRRDPSQIFILGGPSVIPESMATLLRKQGFAVERLSGSDRYGTAAVISRRTFAPGVPGVLIATGRNYPDALAAAAAGAAQGMPVLLVDKGIPAATAQELARLDPATIYIVGGPSVVNLGIEAQLAAYAPVERMAGADRYQTASRVADNLFDPGQPTAILASGENFPDALVAGAIGAPVVLTRASKISDAALDALRRLDPQWVVVVGGPTVVDEPLTQRVSGVLAGS